MLLSRRLVLKLLVTLGAMTALFALIRKKGSDIAVNESVSDETNTTANSTALGIDDDGISRIYLVRNGAPQQNITKIIEMMGGIETIIKPTDIVVLKPNAQWWNQGTTNTDAMQGFIDLVLGIPNFSGEIIIAENHQYDGDNSRGWDTDQRNGKFNLNELVEHYQSRGYKNVTKYHWRVAGTTALPLEGDAQGNSRVTGPEQGDGYVWLEDSFYLSPAGRKCVMTYPVFTSSYSGITIDLKNGAWKDGTWLNNTNVRFINFSALNHHGLYCGVTASVKNLMGVVDMSCGFPGDLPEGTYNTHHIGVSKLKELSRRRLVWRIAGTDIFRRYCYRNFHHTGGALGYFMKHVRMPDLNIITAERVGWGSRVDLAKSFQSKTILASQDPVALDYMAAREVLLSGTPPQETSSDGYRYHELNNPDIKDGPFHKFLAETVKQGVGTLLTGKMQLITWEYG